MIKIILASVLVIVALWIVVILLEAIGGDDF